MRLLEWLLCTIQFRNIHAYKMITEGLKNGEGKADKIALKSWAFKLRKVALSVIHKRKTEFWPNEIVEAYKRALEVFALKSQEFKSNVFVCGNSKIRISGSTIVINESYAVNKCASGIYVHKRESIEKEWSIIYRTGVLISDCSFAKELQLISRTAAVYEPLLSFQVKNGSAHTTQNTLIQ